MQEREYQVRLNNETAAQVSADRKTIMFLPTGGGKTVCFAKLVQRFTVSSGKAVLILVHREELMYQAAATMEEITGTKPHLITSKTSQFRYARVYIGMVESTMSRLNLFDNVGMVIIDECHIANFNKVHEVFLQELIIGVTATPISSSKKEPLNKYYRSIVLGPQISELIKLGFLAHDMTRVQKDTVDPKTLQIDILKGDYNERQMYNEYKLPKHILNTCDAYFKYCFGEKTLIFNVNIQHSKEVCEALVYHGHNARHLASDNNEERAETLKWFRETENAILCNVMFFTFGFDEPTVRNIILNYSTLSLPKFLQSCGRGSRPIDEMWLLKNQHKYPYPVKIKEHFNIIDMGGNCQKFGFWSDDRDWGRIFHHPPVPGEGIAPVKTCPQCDGLVHAAKMVCDCRDAETGEMCFYEFQRKKVAEEQDLEDMILMAKGINIDELTERGKRKHMYYPFLEMAVPIVEEMFKKHGEKQSAKSQRMYFDMYYNLCKEWYNRTLAKEEGNIEDISNSGWHIRKALENFNRLIEVNNAKYKLNAGKLESSKEKINDYISFEEITNDQIKFQENIELYPALIPSNDEFAYDMNFEVGDKLEHKNLGIGEVIEVRENFESPIAKIKFEQHEETKLVMVRYAKMRKIA